LAEPAGLEIIEPTSFQTYIAYRKDATLSSYCEHFIASLRSHMEGQADSTSERPARRPPQDALHKK
jgi:hypothetical protein